MYYYFVIRAYSYCLGQSLHTFTKSVSQLFVRYGPWPYGTTAGL